MGRLFTSLGLLLCIGLCACSGHVQRGQTLYGDGQYVAAAEVFEQTEPRLEEEQPRKQCEYGVYRGLTLMALGDLHGAETWLAYAEQIVSQNPSAQTPELAALLQRGRTQLSAIRQAAPPPQAPPTTAVAASKPAAPVRALQER